jgi:putative tryptophan/tyrosine transport system substrate-binding protein
MTAPVVRILPFTHLAREGRMRVTIRRRELLAALGGAAAMWPLAARAQQGTTPVIGVLLAVSAAQWTDRMAGFHRGLREAGLSESRNVVIEYRWSRAVLD